MSGWRIGYDHRKLPQRLEQRTQSAQLTGAESVFTM
jgi:hypothetical protein